MGGTPGIGRFRGPPGNEAKVGREDLAEQAAASGEGAGRSVASGVAGRRSSLGELQGIIDREWVQVRDLVILPGMFGRSASIEDAAFVRRLGVPLEWWARVGAVCLVLPLGLVARHVGVRVAERRRGIPHRLVPH